MIKGKKEITTQILSQSERVSQRKRRPPGNGWVENIKMAWQQKYGFAIYIAACRNGVAGMAEWRGIKTKAAK